MTFNLIAFACCKTVTRRRVTGTVGLAPGS